MQWLNRIVPIWKEAICEKLRPMTFFTIDRHVWLLPQQSTEHWFKNNIKNWIGWIFKLRIYGPKNPVIGRHLVSSHSRIFCGRHSVSGTPTSWTNELVKTAGVSWMWNAQNLSIWRRLVESYVEQSFGWNKQVEVQEWLCKNFFLYCIIITHYDSRTSIYDSLHHVVYSLCVSV